MDIAREKLQAACCHLLRALGVSGVAVVIDEAIEFMAQEVEAMSPSEPVIGRLYCAALKASDDVEVSP